MIAALYIDPRGPYPRMAGVDCWDSTRDARLYWGPWPVVAHPPCAPFSSLKHMARPDDGRVAADLECGPRAVDQVRHWGGVLEQPAGSRLWERCGLPLPGHGDELGGWCVEVEQVSWGHVARKRTWLYFRGVGAFTVWSSMKRGGEPTHWVSGGRRRTSGNGGLVPPGIKVCSAQQRRRTPPAFAEWLVALARSVRPDAELHQLRTRMTTLSAACDITGMKLRRLGMHELADELAGNVRAAVGGEQDRSWKAKDK